MEKSKIICAIYTDDQGRKICLEGEMKKRNKKFFLIETFKKMEFLGDKIISISFLKKLEKVSFGFKDFIFKETNRQPFNPSLEAWDDSGY